MRSPAVALVAAATVVAVAACAPLAGGELASMPAGEAAVASEPARTTAVLFVERGVSEDSVHVGARFVQFAGLDEQSLPDLLGMPRVGTGASDSTALGCAMRDAVASGVGSTDARAEVHLLDVGPMDVRVGDRNVRLEPRRFPDLWNVVSGVIYATDEALAGSAWRFTAAGNAASRTGGFDLEAHAPDELSGVTVADQVFAPGVTVSVPRRAFAVRWARGDRDDTVVLAVEGAGTVRCAARDEGVLEIDSAWSDRIADLVRAGASLSVHRIRTRPFALAGFDHALLAFDHAVRGRAGE